MLPYSQHAALPPLFRDSSREAGISWGHMRHSNSLNTFRYTPFLPLMRRTQSLSVPLQGGFRFLPHPLPTMPSEDLAISLPVGQAHDRFITFYICTMHGLGSASPPVTVLSASRELGTLEPVTYLLAELVSIFSSCGSRRLTAIHVC
jgi:hypothetical protein